VVELYPHQEKAVKELHNGSILFADVGVGKTITAAAYYMRNEAPRNVIVITTAKKRDSLDWQHDFGRYGVGESSEGTVAGVLTVDSWNNLGKYRDVEGSFFIFDEQRLVGSGQWTKDFIRIARNNRWILLSATPGDTWLDYIPVFIANGFYKNRTEFLREHVIYSRWSKFPKVDRYVGVNKLVKHKNQILVHMPLERHTTRKVETILVDYDQELFKKVMVDRWHVYSERPLRDVAELFSVMRKVVNSSPTRLEAIRSLTQKHPRLIVFYNFDYELEALRSLASTIEKENLSETIQEAEPWNGGSNTQPLMDVNGSSTKKRLETSSVRTSSTRTETASVRTKTAQAPSETNSATAVAPFSVAEWNGHKHQPIPKTDRWLYLVQYQAGAEGWNCIETDAMVFFSLTYSYKNWHQAHGRIDRLNTPFNTLYYYVLMSNSVIDKAIMRALKSKKSFNESRWLRSITTMDSQKAAKVA
jgi:hypothetical protein